MKKNVINPRNIILQAAGDIAEIRDSSKPIYFRKYYKEEKFLTFIIRVINDEKRTIFMGILELDNYYAIPATDDFIIMAGKSITKGEHVYNISDFTN